MKELSDHIYDNLGVYNVNVLETICILHILILDI